MLALGNRDDGFCITQGNFAWNNMHSVKTGRNTWPRRAGCRTSTAEKAAYKQ